MRLALAAVVALLLAACGGGGTDEPAPTQLVVIGNSLTRHPPLPSLGWTGDWGMAASNPAKDYAHLTGAALGLAVDARNVGAIESMPATAAALIPALASGTAGALVVVQLGDNAADRADAEFRPTYTALLDAVRGAARLVCVSTWWPDSHHHDTMIREECERRGGRVAYIGGIYEQAGAERAAEPLHPAVNDHPHDGSMARIAERVIAAAR